jgi:hypothetical protein
VNQYSSLTTTRSCVASAALLLLSAMPAAAAFHLAVIDEVMTGLNGTDDVQFVEVRMTATGQTVVSGSILSAFDSTGSFLRIVLTVPSNLSSGGINRPWIMASTAFAAEAGITPDYTFTSSGGNGLVPEDGMVCWGKPGDQTNPNQYIDCFAYGAYAGPANNHTSAPNPLNPFGHSLVRISETDNSAVDFECADPALPQDNATNQGNIAASLPCTICGNGTTEGNEQCDLSDDATCPGTCQVDCTCANTCGNDLIEGVEECDGTDDGACLGLCQSNCTCNSGEALSRDAQKCVSTAAKNATRIVTSVSKAALVCVKNISNGKEPNPLATCTDADPKNKISGAQEKLAEGIDARCSFPYAIDCDGPCAATDADGTSAATDDDTEVNDCLSCQSTLAAHSTSSPTQGLHSAILNGSTIIEKSTSLLVASCQGAILKAASKHLVTQLKTYSKCSKSELKFGTVPPVGAICIGLDPKEKILKASGKIFTAISQHCAGVPPFDGGPCIGLTNSALGNCVDSISICRACLWANVTMGSSVDCDLEDDEASNGSCP